MAEILGIALFICTELLIYLQGKEDGRREICEELLEGKDGKVKK